MFKKNLVKLKNYTMPLALLAGVLLSLWSVSYASSNPGHSWLEVGDGKFVATGPTALRTYSFPDASAKVLSTSTPVTIAQGGTGATFLSGAAGYVVVSNGSVFSLKPTAGTGLLLGDTATQTLSHTVDVLNNSTTDTGIMAGDLFKSNGSKFVRFATTTALSYVKVNAAGTDLEWATLDPIAGSSGELQYNSGGASWGATSSLAISGNVLTVDKILTLGTTTLPTVAATGTVKLFNRQIASREMLKFRTSESADYSVLQPSLFNNYFCLIRPTTIGTYNSLGCPVASNGTLSFSATELYGSATNATFSATASYVYSSSLNFIRGTTAVGQNGFFYFARVGFPDSSYTNSSGVRLIFGMTDQSTNASCGSDNVTNQDIIAFNYSTALNANWRVAADDGSASAPTYVDTGVLFTSSSTYDMYLYAPPYPDISNIYWRIDNITNGTSTAEGVATTQLPGASVFLYNVACADSVSAVTRNFRFETMYAEVPK
jgi:hypothetical protein